MASRERIQKVLSARGIGSRREVEAWIAAGRITVNGAPAEPGQPVGPRDEVRLDGRKLRLRWDSDAPVAALVYHRPAREGLRRPAEGSDKSTLDRLPAPPGGRWIAVAPLGLGDGGLELFVNDGTIAQGVMRALERLSCEFRVRVRGGFDESRVDEVLEAGRADRESTGSIEALEFAGGEGVNRWARLVVLGLKPRDLKRIFERAGIEANRILRTRLGPVTLDPAMARGRSRRLTEGELQALLAAAGLDRAPVPQGARAKRRLRAGAAGRPPRRRVRTTARR